MAKRRPESSSDGTAQTEAEIAYNTVFIDTSLDTHLAMLVSDADTVSDFKEKIMLEHMQCFPKIRKIKIQTLKVKRRGNFYHLPDFMLVRSAFEGIKRNWFLTAEISSSKECNDNKICSAPDETKSLVPIEYPEDNGQSTLTSKHGGKASEDAEMDVSNTADEHRGDALKMLPSDGLHGEQNVASEMALGVKVDDKTGDSQCNDSTDQSLRTRSPPKKKQKKRHDKDGSCMPYFELDRAEVNASVKNMTLPSDIRGSENSLLEPESEDVQHGRDNLATAALLGGQIDQLQNEVGDVFGRSSQLESAGVKDYEVGGNKGSENHLDSGNRKEDSLLESVISVPENSVAEKQEIIGSDVATVHLEVDASKPIVRREKRKRKKRENPSDNNTNHPQREIAAAVNQEEIDNVDLGEKQKELSLKHDAEMMQPKESGPKDRGEAGGTIGDSVHPEKLSDTGGRREHDNVRKRTSKKSSGTIHQETDIRHADNATSLTCSDVSNVELNNKKDDNMLTPSATAHTTEVEERNLLATQEQTKTLHEADVTIKEPNLSVKLSDADGRIETTKSAGIKRKKKSSKKPAVKIQAASDTEQGINCDDEAMQPSNSNSLAYDKPLDANDAIETAKSSVIKRKKISQKLAEKIQDASDMEQGINGDPEAMQPSNSNSVIYEKLSDANAATETTKSSGIKKKSFHKASAKTQDASDMEQGINGDPEAGPDVTLKETISTEKLLGTRAEPRSPRSSRKKKSVKKSAPSSVEASGMEPTSKEGVNGTSSDGYNPVEVENGRERNLLPLAETGEAKPRAEVASDKKTKMDEENLDPAGSSFGLGDPSLGGQEKQANSSQLDLVNENQENIGHVDKKERRKTKRKQLTALNECENSPTKRQDSGDKDLTAANDELRTAKNPSEAAEVTLSRASALKQLDSSEMEVKDKVKDLSETDLGADTLVKDYENEDEGINFKSYFVPGQQQDKVASSGGVEVSTKSNKKTKAPKNRKKHDSPSVSAALNVQNSSKSRENQEGESISVVGHKELPLNYGQSEALNTKKSSNVSEHSKKTVNQSDVAGIDLQKSEEAPAASDSDASRAATACREKDNQSLGGLSTKRSKSISEKSSDKGQQSDITNRITRSKNAGIVVNSSQPKKSLLAKSGTLFDNISESSGDENGTVNSNASTRTPSDSSSSSGHSGGESELSHESTKNGSKDAEGRGAGEKNNLKPNLSAVKNITMDMLLRSSASFKKAKSRATQRELEDTESQPVEFVPDSQIDR